MKINIITNTFGRYHRQNVAVQSWLHLKYVTHPDYVNIKDYQFVYDEGEPPNYPELETLSNLADVSQNYMNDVKSDKRLPNVMEMLCHARFEDADYVILTNSDVIIMPSLIDFIIHHKPKAMACSRLDIQNIESYQLIIDQNVTPVRYEIAGFDCFVFERDWLMKHGHLYQGSMYWLGKPLWDVVLAGICKVFGDNQYLGNQYPPFCFHIHHGLASVTTECPEKDWNEQEMKENPLHGVLHNIMFYHLKKNLLRRTPWGSFMQPAPDEKSFEKEYFDLLNIHTEKRI